MVRGSREVTGKGKMLKKSKEVFQNTSLFSPPLKEGVF